VIGSTNLQVESKPRKAEPAAAVAHLKR
jgi:hypothetical protein